MYLSLSKSFVGFGRVSKLCSTKASASASTRYSSTSFLRSGTAMRTTALGMRTRRTSARKALALSLSRCSSMCEEYKASTDASGRGISLVASAHRMSLRLVAEMSFRCPSVSIPSLHRPATMSGCPASRTLRELSKLIQPGVGVGPQPMLTRFIFLQESPGETRKVSRKIAWARSASRAVHREIRSTAGCAKDRRRRGPLVIDVFPLAI